MPKGHRILMAGYDMSGFPLTRMVASGKVKVISQERLCFSLEQVETLLKLYRSNANTKDVLELTEGWPIGVTLYALGYTHQVDIYDLLQDVLDRLPEDFVDYLLDLSLAEEWSAIIVNSLQLEFPKSWLKTLKKSGLPLTPLENEVFKPHSLLLVMLRKRLSQQPKRFAELHIRYAQYMAQSGKFSCAMKHAAEANHIEYLEKYAQVLFPKLWKQREFELLLDLTALQLDEVSDWWQEYRAVALIETGSIKEGRKILDQLLKYDKVTALGYFALSIRSARSDQFDKQFEFASAGLDQAGDDLKIKLNIEKASALISLEKPEQGLEITQAMIEEGGKNGDLIQIADILNIHQYGLKMLRQWEERSDILDKISETYHSNDREVDAFQVDIERMNAYILQGRFVDVLKFLEESFRKIEKKQKIFLSLLYHCSAFYMMSLGEYNTAFSEMNKAGKIIIENNMNTIAPVHYTYMYDLYSGVGDRERAVQYLAKAIETSQGSVLERRLMPLFEGLKHFDDGEIQKSKTFFKNAIHLSIEQSYYIRAQVMLLAIEYKEGLISDKRIAQVSYYLEKLHVFSVCGSDRYRLRELLQYINENYPSHPLNRLNINNHSSMEICELEEDGFFIDVGEDVNCFYNGQKIKLPLAKSGELLVWFIWNQNGTLYEILHDLWDGSNETKHHEYFRVLVRKLRAMLKRVMKSNMNPLPYSKETGQYFLNEQLQISCNIYQAISAARNRDYAELFKIRADKILFQVESIWVLKIRSAVYDEQILALEYIEKNACLDNIEQWILILKNALRVSFDKDEFNIAFIRVLLKVNMNEAVYAFQAYKNMLKIRFNCDPDPKIISELRDLGLNI